jgi:hypothetical protein
MARGFEPWGPNKSAHGHAFVVFTVSTKNGVVSDAYGFYPRKDGTSVIKGPGELRTEFRCSKEECLALAASAKDVRDSVTVPATEEERLKIQQLIDEYNGPSLWGTKPAPEYRFWHENCNDFVGRIAEALGYPAPSPTMLPTAYLEQLRSLIKVEQERRALERANKLRLQAEREEERLRQLRLEEEEAERRRLELEEAARNSRPPAGWVKCKCPNEHTRYGRVFNGKRWHSERELECS